MNCYSSLAPWYDRLTGDVPYDSFVSYYEQLFKADGGQFQLLLDLCCGTGSITLRLAEKGYEMIGVDAAADMLSQAQSKCWDLPQPPMFLCQDAAELDLYGTVDAALCCLDGMNYIPPEDLPELFHRLHLFVRPEGLVIFDLRTPEFFQELDGETLVDETEDVLCLWRADFDPQVPAMIYGMDIFSRRGKLWQRDSEEHIEYAHRPEDIKALMEKAGFRQVQLRHDGPQCDAGRCFITAKR